MPTHPSSPSTHALTMMLLGFIKSRLVSTAAKLDIADHLARGPQTSSDLATELGLAAPMMLRLMRAFATCGLARDLGNDTFALTPLGEPLQRHAQESLHNLAVRIHDIEYPAWAGLLSAIERGSIPFEDVFHRTFYAYLASEPELETAFQLELTKVEERDLNALLQAYDFPRAGTIVDIAGGHGRFLAEILKSRPSARGLLLESPSVLKNVPSELVGSRIDSTAVDFFRCIPEGGSLYILKQVLHNWPDTRCLQILRTCRKAMSCSIKLLIIDRVAQDTVTGDDVTSGYDLSMFVLSGGAERNVADFQRLLSEAGLEMTALVETGCQLKIIEAVSSVS
jgi:hypothetical protein